MRFNKIKIIGLLAILFLSVSTFATVNGPKLSVDQRATMRMQKINQVCNLTTPQQTAVKQLFVARFTQQKDKNNSKSSGIKTNAKTRQAARKLNNQNFDNSMKGILTASQFTKWQSYKQSIK